MLHQRVEASFRCPDEVNLVESDAVLQVHAAYLRAGARMIETNTFGANRIRLARFGLADQVVRINERAVKIAREAREIAGIDAFIAGAMGPCGLELQDVFARRDEVEAAFAEQARALMDRGIDCFVLETFPTVEELAIAVRAVRAVAGLPVVAQMTLLPTDPWADPDHDAVDDVTRATLARLAELDADVIGLNCSMGPGQVLPAFSTLARLAPGRLLAVQPNSGLPHREGGRFVFPTATPDYFAWFAREAARRGARLIGGCCGTNPDQIAAIARAVGEAPVTETVEVVVEVPEVEAPDAAASPFARKLAEGRFVISMQVDPPKGTSTQLVLDAVREFRDSGKVDAVDVNSNPMARLHMDALWMSALIERTGVETIAHYTPRDASLMGIEGNLLGAWKMGVRNVLAITGDPSMIRGEPGARDVYQTDSIGLVRAIRQLNDGLDCFGNAIGQPPNFCIGVAVNPNADDLDLEIDRFKAKVDAGANFAMTQVFFEWACWERFLDRFGGRLPIPALVAIWPLTSLGLALRLHNEVPGIVVPTPVLKRLEAAGAGARSEGFAIARGLLDEAKDRAQGAYVIAPFKRPTAALELLS